MTARKHPTHVDDDTPAPRGAMESLIGVFKTSTVLQVGVLLLALALSVAIIRGYNVSFFGIQVNSPTDAPNERHRRPDRVRDTTKATVGMMEADGVAVAMTVR